MGVTSSSSLSASARQSGSVLQGSEWLREVVRQQQRGARRGGGGGGGGGVAEFERFTVEPANTVDLSRARRRGGRQGGGKKGGGSGKRTGPPEEEGALITEAYQVRKQ